MATMDFFGHQQRARSASKWLVLLFIAAVIGIIDLINLVAITTFTVADVRGGAWQPDILAAVAGGVTVVVVLAMLYKTNQLSSGGGKVARMLGGHPVSPDTNDPKRRMLHNIVEEMAIASGIPVPEVYVLSNEAGLNAFAAGWTTKDAAVAVTQGMLDQMNRDELQGVIAHEFSHVFHGDMRLNIRLMGVLFGIVCIATIGRITVQVLGRGSSNRKGGAAGIVIFGVALILIGWLGVLFARLIQAAVSRQREFLADSSAVQYTRNPKGIGMALAKIGGIGAALKNPHADEASHMMFADGVKRFLGGSFATHPPLATRVERVLPGFATELKNHAGMMTEAVAAMTPPPGTSGFSGGGAIGASEFVGSVGDPQPEHIDAARELIEGLPLDILAAARDPQRAGPLALGLLLERDATAREAQLAGFDGKDEAMVQEARMLAPALAQLPHRTRLPLLEMAIPALRQQPPAERLALRQRARALAEADDRITPFEFALLKTLERHVPAEAEPRHGRRGRPTALVQHPRETTMVLSTLAWAGAGDDEEAATNAFEHGRLALGNSIPGELLPRQQCSMAALEPSLDALESVSPQGKRNLLAACAEAASADGEIAAEEADLLRALAELWECPVPLTSDRSPVAVRD